MDPAVVAAHPMPQSQQALGRPASNQTPDTSSLQQSGFGGTSSFGEQQSAFGEQQSLDSELSVNKVDQSVYSQAQKTSSQDYPSTGFSQSNLSHTLQTDSLFSGAVSSGDSNTGNMSMLGKGESPTITHTQFDIPPQLPMPPGHDQVSQVRLNHYCCGSSHNIANTFTAIKTMVKVKEIFFSSKLCKSSTDAESVCCAGYTVNT